MSEDQLSNTEREIWAAPPYALAGTAVTVITKTYGASSVDLLLADYRLDYLVPAASEGPGFRMDGTPAGRAFAAQEPVLRPPGDGGDWDLHLPLAVRGDRLGVLTVSLPDEPARETRQELMALATILSRALKIADEGTDYSGVSGEGTASRSPRRSSGTSCPGARGCAMSTTWPGSSNPRTPSGATTSTGRPPRTT